MQISFLNAMVKCCLLFWIFISANTQSYGQPSDLGMVKEHDGELIIIYSDSALTGDSVIFRLNRASYESSLSFFDTLRYKADQSFITKKLFDFLVVGDRNHVKSGRQLEEYVAPFEKFAGRPIRNIYIRQLNVFGGIMDDSSAMNAQWYKELGNWLHIPTHESIIRENLLFSGGDTVDPGLLRDNGRILRNLEFLKDAGFVFQPVGKNGDSVDVVVLTQDVWAKGFDVNMESINAGEIQLFDDNLLGLGHKLQTNIVFDYFKNSNPGIETFYDLNNFQGTFIDSRFYFMNAFQTRRYGLRLNRDFYSYQTRWAGGAEVFKTKTRRNIVQEDTVFNQVKLDFINHDFWLGFAFPLKGGDDFFRNRSRFILSARYRNDRFFEGPLITRRYNYQFHDNRMFLGKLSFSRENFYQSSLIYGFGRTEDIPVGNMAAYTFGWEMDEFFQRFYSGVNVRHGAYFENLGYLSVGLGAGGFVFDNKLEQGVLHFQTHYISKLFYPRHLKLRQFLKIDYSRGFNRFPDESLRLDKNLDIRGFPVSNLNGNKKLVLKSETVGFTNIYYYGFRFAFYGFCDIGFLGPQERFVLDNTAQTGFGIGFRFKNENFVFNTFQIRLGYYPSLNPENSFIVNLSGERALDPIRYTPGPPHVIKF